jgi:hypothetical protein
MCSLRLMLSSSADAFMRSQLRQGGGGSSRAVEATGRSLAGKRTGVTTPPTLKHSGSCGPHRRVERAGHAAAPHHEAMKRKSQWHL